ncbi:MAG: hypothetical protein AAGA12_05270 [Pseudomonadota bacterium]
MSLKNRLVDWGRRKNAGRVKTSMSGKTYTVNIRFEGSEAIVDLGDTTFVVRSTLPAVERVECNFVVYGLLAMSLTYGAKFKVEAPVTRQMRGVLAELTYAFEVWQIPGLFDPQIELLNVIDEPAAPATSDKIICLSGGLDSTGGAVHAVRDHGFTHGLLIAGADYPTSQSPGYIELRGMVGGLAEKFGLEVVEVETDMRKYRYDWPFLHGLNLGMCLSFLSPHFAMGGIGLDNSAAQDLVRHPWGNTGALAHAMSRPGFPILGFGATEDRVQKLKSVVDFAGPEILRDLSVCWENPEHGYNCGKCTKCIQTRLNFVCAGLEEDLAFDTSIALIDLIDRLPRPQKLKNLRGTFLRTSEFLKYLPDGPLRDRLQPYYAKLKSRLRHSNGI